MRRRSPRGKGKYVPLAWALCRLVAISPALRALSDPRIFQSAFHLETGNLASVRNGETCPINTARRGDHFTQYRWPVEMSSRWPASSQPYRTRIFPSLERLNLWMRVI